MMIYIVRHGETQWNADGRIQGRRDIELNENGRRQAEAAAEALRGKSFQALITSPLSRAKQTGAILAQFAQIAEVREDARIVERDFGELDNASFSLLEWKDGAFTVINYNLDAAYLNGGEDDDE